NNLGLYYELDAILAVALGGTSLSGGRFSVAGAVVGALLMQTLTTTVNSWGIDKSATLILKAGLVIAVCVLQSPQIRAKFERKKMVEA
ncbi:MAG: ABC transporter permease, partial [Armatimonadota bacterium]